MRPIAFLLALAPQAHVSLTLIAMMLASSAMPISAFAADWPQFRGPNFNGSTSETNLPTSWSTTENVAWVAELPGPSAATPVIFGDHIFVSSSDPEEGSLKALCLDRKSGKILWEHTIAEGTERDTRSNFASPTPATDGQRVIFFYGSGELVAFDYSGKKIWERDIEKDYGVFAFQWTFSTSPLLYDGKLFLQVLQRDTPVGDRGFKDRKNESYLLAMNPETGKTLWRQVRPSEAKAESLEAFTSPVPCEIDGKKQILIIGGDDLTGHDAATGEELWRWGTWNPKRIGHWRHVPSPVEGDGIVLVCAPKRDPVYAIKVGKSGKLSDENIAWVSTEVREISSDVPTPAFADGDFFILSDVRKSLLRVEPRTGKVKWQVRTPGVSKFEASPLVADGKIYLINFAGEVTIVNAKDGSIIQTISMHPTREYPVRSTIVASAGKLFIRTNRKLYCIGK